MSYSSSNAYKVVDRNLAEKVLEQGLELRNAMVGSILKNDPFYRDVIYKRQLDVPPSSEIRLESNKNAYITSLDERRLEAFIKGECMTKEEEKLALDTLRSLSAPELCKTAERSMGSNTYRCSCYTCEIYNSNYPNCDINRESTYITNNGAQYKYSYDNVFTREIQDKYTENYYLLKYADSLKISIGSFNLNEMGMRRVLSDADEKSKAFNQNFFLEYTIPDMITLKSKSKQASGTDNFVRLCSRKLNDVIHFRHIEIHDVLALDKVNLDDVEISFKLNYRTLKNKSFNLLGIAKFNFGSFLTSKYLSCSRASPVFFTEKIPIVVGSLKVSLQLGCGRLYFGQEFIDAINSSVHRNSIVLDSDDSLYQLTNTKVTKYDDKLKPSGISDNFNTRLNKKHALTKLLKEAKSGLRPKINIEVEKENIDGNRDTGIKSNSKACFKQIETIFDRDQEYHISQKDDILFGFLFINEAQFLSKSINSYCTCQLFCQSGISKSKVVPNCNNPIYNFSQVVPLIFNNEMLNQLRENCMIIEFWKKEAAAESLIGTTTIPLHQFYLAFRNNILIKYLSKNKLPVIGTDWWEPIYTISDDELVGQVQILAAIGTEDQINNLKLERGFLNNLVYLHKPSTVQQQKLKLTQCDDYIKTTTDKSVSADNHKPQVEKSIETRTTVKNCPVLCDQGTNTITNKSIAKTDIAVQSNLTMEEKNMATTSNKPDQAQDMLHSFLNQLLAQGQNRYVENSTNTDIVNMVDSDKELLQAQSNTNTELRRTTELLDTLQTALSLNNKPRNSRNSNIEGTFKANIAIISANHLPSKKKLKSRKSRSKSVKSESGLPSCYVTFATVSEADVKMTQVISKSTSPTWNFKCDINLPVDLLTNNQKRLVFKVWRKSVNSVMIPNMQTDLIVGFAALDLTVLLAGFPNIQGWFNIMDFSGQCNGQINVHVTPLEDLSKYQSDSIACNQSCQPDGASNNSEPTPDDESEHSELLSRTLKRKFVDLDEITQRLRLRLSKVTNNDSDASSDGTTEQFERDINTLCVEDDFDLVNFKETISLNDSGEMKDDISETPPDLLITESKSEVQFRDDMQVKGSLGSDHHFETISSTSSKSSLDVVTDIEKEMTLDQHFLEGKQKINTLLEKLSLLSAEACSPFTTRYVSGCSMNEANSTEKLNTEAMLTELDRSSRPNIQSSLGFDPLRFQQLYGDSALMNNANSDGTNSPHRE